jgi:hypothetical protein
MRVGLFRSAFGLRPVEFEDGENIFGENIFVSAAWSAIATIRYNLLQGPSLVLQQGENWGRHWDTSTVIFSNIYN